MTFAAILLAANGCGSDTSAGSGEPTANEFDAARRAARIETTGCGLAPDRTGSGVAVGDGLVITVAHLVARADAIEVTVGNGEAVEAAVTAVDLNLDLAALRIPSNGIPDIELSDAARGATGLIVGGAASGTVAFEVKDVVSLSIEEVLGSARHSRSGYELRSVTTTGDSGAGVYDPEHRLIGIVFATGRDGESTWITSSAEVEGFLAETGGDHTPIACNAESSRLELP